MKEEKKNRKKGAGIDQTRKQETEGDGCTKKNICQSPLSELERQKCKKTISTAARLVSSEPKYKITLRRFRFDLSEATSDSPSSASPAGAR